MRFAVWNSIRQNFSFDLLNIEDQDVLFESRKRVLNGFTARVWDHELRHLNGLLTIGEGISHGEIYVNDEFRDNPGMHEMVQAAKDELNFMGE